MYGHLIQQTKFNLFPQYKCTIIYSTEIHVFNLFSHVLKYNLFETFLIIVYFIPVSPPFEIKLHTGAEVLDALAEAEKLIDGFNEKLRVTYDDVDLKGIMETAAREKLSSSQVPKVTEMKSDVDKEGNVQKKEVFSSKYFFVYTLLIIL